MHLPKKSSKKTPWHKKRRKQLKNQERKKKEKTNKEPIEKKEKIESPKKKAKKRTQISNGFVDVDVIRPNKKHLVMQPDGSPRARMSPNMEGNEEESLDLFKPSQTTMEKDFSHYNIADDITTLETDIGLINIGTEPPRRSTRIKEKMKEKQKKETRTENAKKILRKRK